MKTLVIFITLLMSISAYANCSNTYGVQRDAQDLEYTASNILRTAGPRLQHIRIQAQRLAFSARKLERMASRYISCQQLRSEFRFLSNDYRRLENDFFRLPPAPRGRLNFEFNRLRNEYIQLSNSMRMIRPTHVRRPVPPRRGPVTRPYPRRPRGPVTRPAPRRGRPTRRPSTNPPRRGRHLV